jgi:hypothetical protein
MKKNKKRKRYKDRFFFLPRSFSLVLETRNNNSLYWALMNWTLQWMLSKHFQFSLWPILVGLTVCILEVRNRRTTHWWGWMCRACVQRSKSTFLMSQTYPHLCFTSTFFFVILEFELRDLHLLGTLLFDPCPEPSLYILSPREHLKNVPES